jgi:calcineurin-like phosphoesterase
MGDKCPCSNPYQKVDYILKSVENSDYEAILVDFHKETTSE